MRVAKLNGHLKEDRQTMPSSISQCIYIHSAKQRLVRPAHEMNDEVVGFGLILQVLGTIVYLVPNGGVQAPPLLSPLAICSMILGAVLPLLGGIASRARTVLELPRVLVPESRQLTQRGRLPSRRSA